MANLPAHHKSGGTQARDDSTTPFEPHASPTYRDFRLWLEDFNMPVVLTPGTAAGFTEKMDRYWEEGPDGYHYLMTAIHFFVNSFPPDPPLRTDDAGDPLSPGQWAELPWKEQNFWGGVTNLPNGLRDDEGWLALFAYRTHFLADLAHYEPHWYDLYEDNVMVALKHHPPPNHPGENQVSEPIPFDEIPIETTDPDPIKETPVTTWTKPPRTTTTTQAPPTTTVVPPETTAPPPETTAPPPGTTVPPTTTTTPPTTTTSPPVPETVRPKAGLAGLLEDMPAYGSVNTGLEPVDGWEFLDLQGPTSADEGDFDWDLGPPSDSEILDARNDYYSHTYQDPAKRGIQPQPGLWDKIKIRWEDFDVNWEDKSVGERFQWMSDTADTITRPFQGPLELSTMMGHRAIGVGSWALHFGSKVIQDMYDLERGPFDVNQVAGAEPFVVLKEKFTQEEYNNLYRNLQRTDPELAEAMGPPAGSPFVSGDAVIVGYRSPTDIDRVRKLSGKHGVEIDPDHPWIMSKIGSRHSAMATNPNRGGRQQL